MRILGAERSDPRLCYWAKIWKGLCNSNVSETIEKINTEKDQLFSGLKEEKYFEIKPELFMNTNLFFEK